MLLVLLVPQTNAHCIADATYVTVKRHGSGTRYEGLIYTSFAWQLCICRSTAVHYTFVVRCTSNAGVAVEPC
jgi:hypothetical protein